MDYNTIEKYISTARLVRYEEVCDGNHKKVLKMYQSNLRLSQAFYPLLSLFEVVLRNALNEKLIVHFDDPNWLKNQRSGFMSDARLTYTSRRGRKVNDFLKKSVDKQLRRNPSLSQGKIISDLNFGFWTELFNTTHYQILKGVPIRIFTNLPSGTNRSLVNQKLDRIRKFRNRISHHEAIIFDKDDHNKTILSLDDVSLIYKDIIEVFDWLNLDFNKWTRKINSVEFEIKRLEYVFSSYPRMKYYHKRLHLGLRFYLLKYFGIKKF